jgi:hypothetical protein
LRNKRRSLLTVAKHRFFAAVAHRHDDDLAVFLPE